MITISPGHWHVGTGAVSLRDEVTEARKVVNGISFYLRQQDVPVHIVVDNKSKNQRQNLIYLVQEHNKTKRKIDVSIHFNALKSIVDDPLGVEVLYQHDKAKNYASAISSAISHVSDLKNRGAKRRADLAFLNGVNELAVLIEVCFINSSVDVKLYETNFRAICDTIGKQLIQML